MVTENRHSRAVVGLLTSALVGLAIGADPATGANHAVPALSNGGFEQGTLAHWSHAAGSGSQGRWSVDTGTSSPVSGFRIPAPPQGRFQAVVDQGGPGSHVLFRKVETGRGLALRLTFWYRNRNPKFYSPRTLRFDQVANQQFRIDIMRAHSALRSMRARDILSTPFRTMPGDPRTLGPRTLTIGLSQFKGRDVRLRITEVDNQFFFQAGVDAVRFARVGRGGGVSGLPAEVRLGQRRSGPAPVVGAYTR